MESSAAHTADQERQRRSRTSPWPRYDEAALGFRNYWYPAMMSYKLRRRPVALRILGEKLLFTRQQHDHLSLSWLDVRCWRWSLRGGFDRRARFAGCRQGENKNLPGRRA